LSFGLCSSRAHCQSVQASDAMIIIWIIRWALIRL